MKSFLLVLIMSSVAMGQVSKTNPAKETGATVESAADQTISARRQTFSYALGMSMWAQLASTLKKQSVQVQGQVDPDFVAQGFEDAMSGGKTRMTSEEAQSVLEEVQTEAGKAKQAETPRSQSCPAGFTRVTTSFGSYCDTDKDIPAVSHRTDASTGVLKDTPTPTPGVLNAASAVASEPTGADYKGLSKKQIKQLANSQSDARRAFADAFARAIELDGWNTRCSAFGYTDTSCVSTTNKRACGFTPSGFHGFCRAGDRTVLVVWVGPLSAMLNFARNEVEPRMSELRQLGFAWVELRSDQPSANFPDGVWDIPVR
jgi:Domain amino terminal to FKBP-type peptidyl-prolyl isomerase